MGMEKNRGSPGSHEINTIQRNFYCKSCNREKTSEIGIKNTELVYNSILIVPTTPWYYYNSVLTDTPLPNLGDRLILNASRIDPIDESTFQCDCKELSEKKYIHINRDCKRKDEDCDPLWKKTKTLLELYIKC